MTDDRRFIVSSDNFYKFTTELKEQLKRKINDNCLRDKNGSGADDIVHVFLRDKAEVVIPFSGEIMMDVIVR